jgi:hypothetical protein
MVLRHLVRGVHWLRHQNLAALAAQGSCPVGSTASSERWIKNKNFKSSGTFGAATICQVSIDKMTIGLKKVLSILSFTQGKMVLREVLNNIFFRF